MSRRARKKDEPGSGRGAERRKRRLNRLRHTEQDKPLAYWDVRDKIREGDLLLFQGDRTLSWVIRWVTHGVYSHSALVVPAWHDRLLVMQAEAHGVEIAPASHAVDRYDGKVDWWALADEAYQQLKPKKFMDALLDPVGKPYDFRGAFWLGLLKLFHVQTRTPTRRQSSYFCSEYVAEVLREGGIDMGGMVDAKTSPSDFASCGLFIYRGTLHKKVPEQTAATE